MKLNRKELTGIGDGVPAQLRFRRLLQFLQICNRGLDRSPLQEETFSGAWTLMSSIEPTGLDRINWFKYYYYPLSLSLSRFITYLEFWLKIKIKIKILRSRFVVAIRAAFSLYGACDYTAAEERYRTTAAGYDAYVRFFYEISSWIGLFTDC